MTSIRLSVPADRAPASARAWRWTDSTPAPAVDQGFWFSRSPEVGSDFAELAAESKGGQGANVIKARLKMRRPQVIEVDGAELSNLEIKGAILDAIEAGHDSIVFRNLVTKAGSRPKRLSDVAVVLRPDQIRSVFAKFDPKNVASGDLLASLAGAGLLIGLGTAGGDGAD